MASPSLSDMDQDPNSQPPRKPRGEGVPGAPKGPKTWTQENFQDFEAHQRARNRHWYQNRQQIFGMNSPPASQQEQKGSPPPTNATSPSQELSQRSDKRRPQGSATAVREDGAAIQHGRRRAPPLRPSALRPLRSGGGHALCQEWDSMLRRHHATSQHEDGPSFASVHTTLPREYVLSQPFGRQSPPRDGNPPSEESDTSQPGHTRSLASEYATLRRHENPTIQRTSRRSPPSEYGAMRGEKRADSRRGHRYSPPSGHSTPGPSRPMEMCPRRSGIHALKAVWQQHAVRASSSARHACETRDRSLNGRQGSKALQEAERSIQKSNGSTINTAAASSCSRDTKDWSFLNTLQPYRPWGTAPTSTLIDLLSRPSPTRGENPVGAIAAEALRAGLLFPSLSREQIGVPLGSAVLAGEIDDSGMAHQELDSADAAESNVPTQGKGDGATEDGIPASIGDCLSRF